MQLRVPVQTVLIAPPHFVNQRACKKIERWGLCVSNIAQNL